MSMYKIKDLKQNTHNPRHIAKDKLEKLKKSIKEFEQMLSLRPITIDEDGVVLGGNMRLQALKKLGHKEIPDEWVQVARGLTEAQKREFIIKDNVGFGQWDWDLLQSDWDIEELEEWGMDIPEFDELEIEAKEDDYQEPEQMDIDVVEGDLIEFICEDGRVHRLLCGDSTDLDAVARLMDSNKADMVFTDPPYGVDYKGINNDDRSGLEHLLRGAFNNMMLNTKNGGSFYCFHSDRCADIFHNVYREFAHFSSMVIWKKESIVLSQTDYQSIHEPCIYGWFNNGTHKWYGDRKERSVWDFKAEKFSEHTTPKPIQLITKALNNSSKVGFKVLDCFGGSGSTMVAAHQTQRTAFLMELDPKYCQVITDRMVKLDDSIKVKINGSDYVKNQQNPTH